MMKSNAFEIVQSCLFAVSDIPLPTGTHHPHVILSRCALLVSFLILIIYNYIRVPHTEPSWTVIVGQLVYKGQLK